MVTIVLVCSSMIASKCHGLDKTFGDGCKGMGYDDLKLFKIAHLD